jgi:cytochrome c553
MMMRVVIASVLCALGLAVNASEALASGEKLMEVHGCVTCHGKTGVGTDPSYPTLAGQHESYLAHSIRAYRTGERKHELMKGYVEKLSEKEIDMLAEYLAKQSSTLHDLSYME